MYTQYANNNRPSAFAADQMDGNYQQNYQTSFSNYPQQQPQRSFMSSIATIYSDYESNINHKRRMQQELAESLRRQIEEKKARSQMQQPQRRNTIQQQANELLNEMQTGQAPPNNQQSYRIQNPNYSQPPQSINDVSRTQPERRVTFVQQQQFSHSQPPPEINDETLKPYSYKRTPKEKFVPFRGQFYSDPPKQIQVSTESPFAHQSVSTPPLGFSVRNVQNLRNSYPSKQQMFGFNQQKSNFLRNSYQKQTTFSETFYAKQNPQSQIKQLPTISQMFSPDGSQEEFPV